jgi:hypothetical protein
VFNPNIGPDADVETVEQLQEMLELLDQFPEIADHSISVIWGWLDGDDNAARSFAGRPRKESAAVINQWFRDRINSRNQRTV